MRIAQILFSQGFGSRRDCAALLAAGLVQVHGRVVEDPQEDFDTAGLSFQVQGRTWPFHATAVVLLHKPAGYECSAKPRHHPSVLSLLPTPLRTRGLQPVGRLDEDTTGLLLLTDSGPLIHRLTSPKWHVPKVYEVRLSEPATPQQAQQLMSGVVLHDDPLPARALACELHAPHHASLTLTEGRYHQVKRMWAAVGNHVQQLHRSRFGTLALGVDLPAGSWRWLTAEEQTALDAPRRAAVDAPSSVG
jgi:16S rRNA pseudouridine516 synthase